MIFLIGQPKCRGNQGKNKTRELNQAKKFLHNKINNQWNEATT
jgi:hypothetical protein